MTTFYIYEVPGIKNGATKTWETRSAYNFNQHQVEPIIVETMEGPDIPEFWQVVGDREWELADLNGYSRGTHYRVIRVKSNHNNKTTQNSRIKKGGPSFSPGNHKEGAAKGGAVSGTIEYTCPYCSKVGKGGRMKQHINIKFCQK